MLLPCLGVVAGDDASVLLECVEATLIEQRRSQLWRGASDAPGDGRSGIVALTRYVTPSTGADGDKFLAATR